MSFALTFSWRRFVLAMGDRDCANKNESAVFAFGVPAKNFAHQMLPPELSLGLPSVTDSRFVSSYRPRSWFGYDKTHEAHSACARHYARLLFGSRRQPFVIASNNFDQRNGALRSFCAAANRRSRCPLLVKSDAFDA